MQTESQRELSLLEQIEQDPDITQASLARQLGVAVGTVNWHIKRLIEKGYVKVRRAERKKLRYIITAEGIALRARLTVDYIEQSFNLYRRIRQRVQEQLDVLSAAGYARVRISGNGEIAEVCKLTCLEKGIEVVEDESAPLLEIRGMKILLLNTKSTKVLKGKNKRLFL
ncbi:MAG: winged helix-turn-helix transcriptional regulator [Anaerolineales bacterium]|uniref:Winged helix-turn-helix transcriptional regulator n=1 Tax=Candidatus Desulfolinea nitratireducens TaxID=2841698 RepID=A0A8J6TF80_9CHLR|nr:winged helix-turn-helix transcriptional regulator [Candidatus Desulfolinea nitratireducens]MBL6959514.1 winged helix-turn-helix transcriptional regulator [Anaerolineales bacterium]